MTDRRITPANGRVAHVSLRGQIEADRYVEGTPAQIAVPVANLLARPNGPRDRQLLFGETVLVLDRDADFAFIRADKDGYCGYLAEPDLTAAQQATHWVSAPASILYQGAGLKTPDVMALSHGARLTISADRGDFLETGDGLFVPRPHIRDLGNWLSDPAAVAEAFLGTPYLWGGNSFTGIDCSGLIQAALVACGMRCPGDSDLQEKALGRPLSPDARYARGDLFFWPGHVAMAVSADRLIHANGYQSAVGYETIAECIARIDAQGEGPLTGRRRLDRAPA